MRMYLAALLLMTQSGCVSGPASDAAVCSRSEGPRAALASALVDDGGPKSMAAGRTLIATIDSGCLQ